MTERDLFISALDRPPGEQEAYLDRACGADTALRARVGALLEFHARPSAVLDRPAAPCGPGEPADEPAGTVFAGRYTLLGVIGRGGMGTVYLARQTEPVEREVAVKVVRGRADLAALARFAAERQTLAVMSHPGIARVYDGGTTPGGQPFFVMELVRGEPLTAYCDARRLPVPARLGLFVALCEAVQHAHQKGIVHRDLKPSNVLAADADGRPAVTVIDFGIAVARHAADGLVAGTFDYMAPEQAAAVPDIDTRADVYSLGVVLFELLSGATPAAGETAPLATTGAPPTASDRARAAAPHPANAAARAVPPAQLPGLLRGDLDWVVRRCLDRDRERRYPTVAALADDVRLFVAGRPLATRPIGAGARAAKWCRRNPWLAGLAAAVVVLAAAVTTGAVVTERQRTRDAAEQARLQAEAEAERERARDEAAKAREEGERAAAVTEFLKEMYAPHDDIFVGSACLGFRDAREKRSEHDVLRLGVARLSARDGFRGQPLVRAGLLFNIGTAYFGLGRTREAEPLLEEALQLRRKYLPAGHPDLAPSVLAVAHVRTMLTDEVHVELYREAMALLEKSPDADPDGMWRAEAEASYAVMLLHYWGEKAEALPMLERAYAARRRVLGDAHPQTLSTLLVLASLQLDDGDYVSAAPKLGALITGLEKCTARPELLECGRAWANMLAVQALRGEAAAVAPGKRAVEAFTRVFGPDHYLTVRVRYSVAWLHINTNDRPAALAALRECLAGVERWGPPNRFTRAQIHLQIGRMHRGQGEPAEAMSHLRTAVELFRHVARRPGECRHEYAWGLQVLSQHLDPDSQGGLPEAGALLAEAAAYCARPGVDETRRGKVLINAAWWYHSNGDVARAGGYARDAVKSWERAGPAGTPELVVCLALHSVTLRRCGQGAEADAAAGRCRDLLGRIPASSHQATAARALLDGNLPSSPP